MKLPRLLFGIFLFSVAASAAHGKAISPGHGEGKYRFCQRMFNTCMDGVFGKPGSHSYNVGRARCRAKWNSCRKTGKWHTTFYEMESDMEDYADEEGFDGDAGDEELVSDQ